MTKKQVGIIFTLLALIVCTAILGAKLNNGGLNDATDLAGALVEGEKDEDKDKETISQTDFFIDARSTRENNDASAIQGLKDVVENDKTSKEQKDAATAQITKITLRQSQQKTIETNIKNKGYSDAICEISDDSKKADIIVKSDNQLTEKEGAIIQEIVQSACGISDVNISVKK